MKAFLMFRDRDFDLKQQLPSNADALVQDLELETLFGAMAAADPLIHDVSKVAVLSSVQSTVDEMVYRQHVMTMRSTARRCCAIFTSLQAKRSTGRRKPILACSGTHRRRCSIARSKSCPCLWSFFAHYDKSPSRRSQTFGPTAFEPCLLCSEES